MSYVTAVTLQLPAHDWELPNVEKLQAWLEGRGHGRLVEVADKHYGGGKHPQVYVFGGGYNYLEVEAFIRQFHALEWGCPESVVLLTETEGEGVRASIPSGERLLVSATIRNPIDE